MKLEKEYDDSWRWTADLIVKYAPENYDERGIYRKDEWTSSSDIGKVYDGKRFTREEYLETEDKYVQAVIRGMELAGCSFLTVEYLSIHRNKRNMKRFTPKDPKDPLHEQNKALYEYVPEHKGRHAYTYLPNRESRTFKFKGVYEL